MPQTIGGSENPESAKKTKSTKPSRADQVWGMMEPGKGYTATELRELAKVKDPAQMWDILNILEKAGKVEKLPGAAKVGQKGKVANIFKRVG